MNEQIVACLYYTLRKKRSSRLHRLTLSGSIVYSRTRPTTYSLAYTSKLSSPFAYLYYEIIIAPLSAYISLAKKTRAFGASPRHFSIPRLNASFIFFPIDYRENGTVKLNKIYTGRQQGAVDWTRLYIYIYKGSRAE